MIWFKDSSHCIWHFLYLASSLRGFVVGEVHSWTNCNYCFSRSWQIGRVLSCTHIWYLLYLRLVSSSNIVGTDELLPCSLICCLVWIEVKSLEVLLDLCFLSKLWSSLRYSFLSLQHHFSVEGSKLSTVSAVLVTSPFQPLPSEFHQLKQCFHSSSYFIQGAV